jgi:hypothetical protein
MMLIIKFYMLEIVHYKIQHQRFNIKGTLIYNINY